MGFRGYLYYQVYRVKSRIGLSYRKNIFKRLTGCEHDDFNIVGDIILINTNIKIGRGVTIYPGAMFWGDGIIKIGNNVDIGKDTILYSSKEGGIYIGDDTQIAAQCYIIDMDHGIEKGTATRTQSNKVKKIIIGEDVWIAANCTILRGSRIGDGAIIGAKSLISGEIDGGAVMVSPRAVKLGTRE